MTIGFDPEFADHLPLVDNSRNHALVQTKLAELGHPHTQVKFIKAEAPDKERAVVPAPEATSPITPLRSSVPDASFSKALATADSPAKARSAPASAPFNKEDFKNDPLIRKALEVFKGQIVDVRS
jgi:hypothetical protein